LSIALEAAKVAGFDYTRIDQYTVPICSWTGKLTVMTSLNQQVARRCSTVGKSRKAAVFKGAILGFPSFDGKKLDKRFTQSWPGLKSMMAGVFVKLGRTVWAGIF
jgi:hypothetical protein